MIDKPKWTLGPWSREAINALLRFGRKNSGPWEDHDDDGNLPDDDSSDLISAAPDLYDALKSVEWEWNTEYDIEMCSCCGELRQDGHHKNCKLAAALAKAEGRKP